MKTIVSTLIASIVIVGFIDVFAVRLIEYRAITIGWAIVILTNIVAFAAGAIVRSQIPPKPAAPKPPV